VSGFDLAIVVLYLLGTTLLGSWFSRRQRNLASYFVGDRNVSWWLVLISIVATETSTVTFLSVPGVAYARGGNLTFLQLAMGYILGRCLVAWLLLPQYMRGELLTAYQLLRQRFSPAVQRTASGLFILTRTLADGLRLMLTAFLLHEFTGLRIEWAILVMGLSTILYTFLGGMQAVIWTDLIQFVIYILGALIAAGCLVMLLPGGMDEVLSVGTADNKFQLINLSPDPRQPFTLWTGLIGGAFFTMASHGADQLMVQRYLCSRSLNQARVALVLSGVVVFLQFLLFLLIGVGLAVFYQEVPDCLQPDRPDAAFGAFIVKYLPQGVIGVVIAAVLAAAMSTLSSSLNSSANAFVVDFWRPWLRPGASETQSLFLGRIMTAFFGVAQIVVALVGFTLHSDKAVVEQVLTVAGFTTGMILGLFVLGLMPRPVSSPAALIGLVAGFLGVLLVWLPSALGQPLLAWPWFAPVGATYTIAVALVVEVLTRALRPPGNRRPQPGLEQPR
jgi:SSS family transporter